MVQVVSSSSGSVPMKFGQAKSGQHRTETSYSFKLISVNYIANSLPQGVVSSNDFSVIFLKLATSCSLVLLQ